MSRADDFDRIAETEAMLKALTRLSDPSVSIVGFEREAIAALADYMIVLWQETSALVAAIAAGQVDQLAARRAELMDRMREWERRQ